MSTFFRINTAVILASYYMYGCTSPNLGGKSNGEKKPSSSVEQPSQTKTPAKPSAVIPSVPTPAPTNPPTVIPPAPTSPPGVIPPASTNPPAAIPPTPTPPGGVIPPAPTPPPGVIPPETTPPPGVIPNGEVELHFPAACMVGDEGGSRTVTDPDYFIQLRDQNGKVVAASAMGPEAIARGYSCESKTGHGCFTLKILPSFAGNTADGNFAGSLNLCRAKYSNKKAESNECLPVEAPLPPLPQSNFGPQATTIWYLPRVNQYINFPIEYSIANNVIKVTKYSGMPNDPNGETALLAYHGFYSFIQPGACQIERESPLVLQLNRKGKLDLIDHTNSAFKITFDFNGDGTKSRSGWIGKNSAFLAIDLNGNGSIDNGKELFGQASTRLDSKGEKFSNGFEALAQYDSNQDGKVDKNDSIFENLLVWQDLNSDGQSTPSEIQSLKKLGVSEISLNFSNVNDRNQRFRQNNLVGLESTYQKKKATFKIFDVWFGVQKEGSN